MTDKLNGGMHKGLKSVVSTIMRKKIYDAFLNCLPLAIWALHQLNSIFCIQNKT